MSNIDLKLIEAAKAGDLKTVKYLMGLGADIHYLADEAFRTSVFEGRIKVVKFLVEHGANIELWYDWAIVFSKMNDHPEITKYLEEQMK